jgi:Domain of unknown function (DUF4118)
MRPGTVEGVTELHPTEPRIADEPSSLAGGLGACAAIGVAALLVPFRDWLGSSNVALILAIVVVIAAIFGGRSAGVLTSVAAALAFDFFHTEPYLDLRIDRRVDIIAGALLLVLGLVVGEIAAMHQKEVAAARRHERGAAHLEDVAEVIAAGADAHEVWPVVKRSLVEQLDLADCRFEPAPFDRRLPDLTRSGRVDAELLHYESGGFTLPSEGVEVPVNHSGHLLGRLVLVPQPHRGTTRPQRRVAVAIADQLAVALAHTQPIEKLS